MVTNYEGEQIQIPENMPMLPVRDIVIFPFMILPLFVGRDSSIKAVEESLAKSDRLIFLSSQKDTADEFPQPEGIYETGTIAMIMRMRKLPDGRIKILAQGLTKAKVKNFSQTEPFYRVNIESITDEELNTADAVEAEALMRSIRENLERVISLGRVLSPDIMMVLDDVSDPGRLADLVASNLGLKMSEAQALLEIHNPLIRIKQVNEILLRELEVLTMQAKIRSQAKDEMSKSQKEYFLREQIRAIKNELGDSDNKQEEIQELRQKVIDAKMPAEAETEVLKQINRLDRMHPDSSEASILRSYLELLVELPWNKSSQDNLDLKNAKKILDEDHFDLKKIKERCLEYLAVRKLNKSMKGPILCFSGPPGVGKTSLGKSIARALGREFHRISLGGMKDEAEIRGHRRTYVGAMPGKIIQGLKQVKTNNPVFILDEIDKLGNDFRGDPSSALLEVLDPEQNNSFRDHYLNLPFDLSNVMFLATANVLENIPAALRDRMEVIQLSGYTEDEKLKIAKQYLVSKQIKENGITEKNIDISDEALKFTIENYTREAGLRNLERLVGTLCRKVAHKVAEGEKQKISVTPELVAKFLGPQVYTREDQQEHDEVGVSTGLAWTQAGGEILYIETSMCKGKGGVILTGQMGDVMKESATTAMSFIRGNAHLFGIDEKIYNENDVHIHIPAGAIPKDGPSAGIAMATAIISRLSGVAIRKDIAMTGEMTLTGKVLPIGGLKEKSLAAMRHGIQKIIIPHKNIKDLEDIDEEYRSKLEFIPVKHIDEVLQFALVKPTTSSKKDKKSSSGGGGRSKDRISASERVA
ncbi:MAG: endopeptidase La [Oligoflexia bacterium]|nr:endopeptidase La [Oligoflexia bacterium]